jgi:hypothetical protein
MMKFKPNDELSKPSLTPGSTLLSSSFMPIPDPSATEI